MTQPTVTRTGPAWWVGLVDRVAGGVLPDVALDEEAIRRAVGGPLDQAIDAPLAALVADLAEARAPWSSRLVVRELLVDALRSRARVLAAPEPAGEPLADPVVIVGLHRSGTTFLHHLLDLGPDARAPRHWELAEPVGPPAAARRRAQVGLRVHRALAPEMRVVHPVAADDPEECWPLLLRSLAAVSLDLHADVPRWKAWWRTADLRPAYALLARQLGLLATRVPARRFVLKCPEHLWALDALFAVFPRARVVWLHRDPAACVPSYCALSALQRRVFTGSFHPESVGAHVLDRLAEGWSLGMAARAGRDSAFVDVRYEELVADPVGTAARVCEAVGIGFDREATLAWLRAHPPDGRPAHQWDPAFYGLDPARIRAAFADGGGASRGPGQGAAAPPPPASTGSLGSSGSPS